MSHHLKKSRALVALGLGVAVALAAAYWQAPAVGQDTAPAIQPKQVHQAEQLSAAFRHAAEVAMPSVVTVRSKTKAHPTASQHGRGKGNTFKGENPFKGTPFEDFFGEGDLQGMVPRQMPRSEGMGSGVIIDKSGIVLTNNHVVEGADEVTIHLADGREFKADEIKTDPRTDLALVHIKGAGSLPAAQLGDSDNLAIGDWVLAIGNPFELEHTVSAGIISGKGRELGSIPRAKFLQTDAAINPGNSGGPLVNLEGEVIGINTAIATNNGGYQGVGFAIPSNLAKWVMGQLMKKGSVERAYLGVGIAEVSKDLAKQFGVERGQGVLVAEVFPKSPAAEAGFKGGDIIVEYGSQAVHSPRELQELVERTPLDSREKVTVLRDGKRETLSIVAKALPKELRGGHEEEADESPAQKSENYESENLGMEVAPLNEKEAKTLGFDDFKGVLISKVEPEGVAAEQGLRAGMLIMRVGNKDVTSVEEFKAAMEKESLKDGIMLWVRTKQGNRFVVLQPQS